MARLEAKRHGCVVVFWLCNFLYPDIEPFAGVDATLVPSRAMADSYRQTLGLDATPIFPLIDRSRVHVAQKAPWFLTYVSPCPTKGGLFAARIFSELSLHHPLIPILVVEGRGKAQWLKDVAPDGARAWNVQFMPTIADARRFLATSRVLLMPSVREAFGMLAVEGFINEIPVIASRRDGLVEACREGGILLDIPPRHTEDSTFTATVDEVKPWVEAIARLWYDASFYDSQVERCRAAARALSAETLLPQYVSFFESLQERVARTPAVGNDRASNVVIDDALDALDS